MPQLSDSAAEKMSTEQATALARVLDLQARWENHRDDPAKTATSTADLQTRQKAFEAFRSALREYAVTHNDSRFPEPTQNVPERLVIWCRALRAVFRRAEGPGSAFLVSKVHRLADRIAARTGLAPVERQPVADRDATVRELDAVVAWCERAAAPAVKEEAA